MGRKEGRKREEKSGHPPLALSRSCEVTLYNWTLAKAQDELLRPSSKFSQQQQLAWVWGCGGSWFSLT